MELFESSGVMGTTFPNYGGFATLSQAEARLEEVGADAILHEDEGLYWVLANAADVYESPLFEECSEGEDVEVVD